MISLAHQATALIWSADNLGGEPEVAWPLDSVHLLALQMVNGTRARSQSLALPQKSRLSGMELANAEGIKDIQKQAKKKKRKKKEQYSYTFCSLAGPGINNRLMKDNNQLVLGGDN